MSTQNKEGWRKELWNLEKSGIYHVDGAEYNVKEDRLEAFIAQVEKEKENLLIGKLKELIKELEGHAKEV